MIPCLKKIFWKLHIYDYMIKFIDHNLKKSNKSMFISCFYTIESLAHKPAILRHPVDM